MFFDIPLVLAQEEAPPIALPAEGARDSVTGGAETSVPDLQNQSPRQSAPGGGFIWIFMLILVVFWVFIMSGQRREKKKKAALLASIQKGDKVQTAGGIIGTVVEIRPSDVLLKVDENANTRIKFRRSAIQNIVQDDQD